MNLQNAKEVGKNIFIEQEPCDIYVDKKVISFNNFIVLKKHHKVIYDNYLNEEIFV